MSSDLNTTVLIGRLTKDPELRYTQTGTSIAKFSIANNHSYGSGENRKDVTSFFNCIAWGQLGEIIVQYSSKGQRIALNGRLQQRTWEDSLCNRRSIVEVVVENVQFLSPKGNGDDTEQPEYRNLSDSVEHTGIEHDLFNDDDIPF